MVKRTTIFQDVEQIEAEQQPLTPAPPSITAPDALASDTIAQFGDDPDFVTALARGLDVIVQGRLVSRSEMAERHYQPLQKAAMELGSLLLP
jgi:hypothetical protein